MKSENKRGEKKLFDQGAKGDKSSQIPSMESFLIPPSDGLVSKNLWSVQFE